RTSEVQPQRKLHDALLIDRPGHLSKIRIVRICVGHAENMPVRRVQQLSLCLQADPLKDMEVPDDADVFVIVVRRPRIRVVARIIAQIVSSASGALNGSSAAGTDQLRVRVGESTPRLSRERAGPVEIAVGKWIK